MDCRTRIPSDERRRGFRGAGALARAARAAVLAALLPLSCTAKRPPAPPAPAPPPAPAAPRTAAAPRVAAARRLENSFPSERALAEAVLAALRRRDEQALAALRLTEREYKDLLWPELPQARDPRHTLTVDFHWENLDRQSRAGVQGAMGDHGGEDFELIEVVPEGVEELETCKLLRRVKLKVRRRADGKESLIRVCGSILVLDGQYKLVSFPS